MNNRFVHTALIIGCAATILAGCGEKMSDEMTVYKASMETFCGNISYVNDQINNIDAESDTAVTDLLDNLDTLNDQFLQMSELEVPEEFANVDELADSASENMSMAVSYYHQAYDDPTMFNQNYVDAADEYYSRANLRLQYILRILHGEDVAAELNGSTAEAGTDASDSEASETDTASEMESTE